MRTSRRIVIVPSLEAKKATDPSLYRSKCWYATSEKDGKAQGVGTADTMADALARALAEPERGKLKPNPNGRQ
jgi:hypothetical protein